MTHASASGPPPDLDVVALFGFLSALVTLACLPYLRGSRPMKLMFAASLAANTVYAFVSGAWPLGMVAVVVTGMAVHSCWKDRQVAQGLSRNVSRLRRADPYEGSRVFGSSFDSGQAAQNN